MPKVLMGPGPLATTTDAGLMSVEDKVKLNNINEIQIDKTIDTPAAIMSFPDGADGLPMALTVGIEPVQDLHGYANPWPAGGGKNLVDININTSVYSGSITFDNPIGETVTISAKKNSVVLSEAVWIIDILMQDNTHYYIGDTGYSSPFPQTINATAQNPITKITWRNYGLTSGSYDIQMEKGSTATAWTPYSNICPISGWTGANVSRTGKNLLDISSPESDGYYITDGDYSSVDTYSCYKVAVKPETEYTISGNFAGIVTYWDSGLNFISGINQWSGFSKSFTTPANCAYIRKSILKTSIDGTQMLELGSIATAYEPYLGTVYPITFPAAAGTVYGGTLTVNKDGTGNLVVDRANIASYNGETLPSTWISDRDVYAQGTTPTTGAQVVYELATPVTYSLTPGQVKTLLGVNNIWADTGNINSITYSKQTSGLINTYDKVKLNSLAAVSLTGNYNDLLNKPTIPTIPTNVSSLTNDAGYLTSHQDISGLAPKASPVFTGSISLGRNTNTTVGNRSIAVGDYLTASADYTAAFGQYNSATAAATFVSGYSNTASGYGTHAEGGNTIASGYYAHAEGSYTRATGDYAHAEGIDTQAAGIASHAEGRGSASNLSIVYANYSHFDITESDTHGRGTSTSFTSSNGAGAFGECTHTEGYYTYAGGAAGLHAEGYYTVAAGTNGQHAEGYETKAGGNIGQHAEGYRTSATGNTGNHAEGYYTMAYDGYGNHAEGYYSYAEGDGTHAEGRATIALGKYSHAEGYDTITKSKAQHAEGQYNIADSYTNWPEWEANTSYNVGDKVKKTSSSTVVGYICKTANEDSTFTSSNWTADDYMNFLHIAGNGTADNARSNAYALEWSGTGRYKGDLYVNCNADSTGGNKVATEAYVTTAIANASLSGGGSSVTLATVATTGDYDDLINKPDLSSYLTSVPTMVGATSSVAGTAGLVPAPTTSDTGKFLRGDGIWTAISTMIGATSSVAGASGLVPAPTTGDVDKFLAGDGTYKSGGLPMVILSYGSSTWAQFEAAYNNNVIVYCRASSNSDPASGSQTRMAFMAYVNNATTPANVEFQYYRSVSSHSATQMGDQVFIYKLDKTSGWSVTTREASIKEIKIDSSSAGSVSWSSNKVTLNSGLPKVTASDNGKILKVVNGAWAVADP